MTISEIFNKSLKTIKLNSPEILTGAGIIGVATTAYLSARAAFKASKKLNAENAPIWEAMPKRERIIKQFKETWPLYIPPVVSGGLTIASVVGSNRASGARTAAAVAAYTITERAFSEYKEKVVEQIGTGKEQKIRDEIAQDRITKNPPEGREILVVGKGDVLCCELMTGRYFKCDMETLRRAENEINHMINTSAQLGVTLSDFYDILDLPHTSTSDKMNWNSEKLLELQFSAVLTPDHEPCIAFDYNYIWPYQRN